MSAHMSARSIRSGAFVHSLLNDAINTKILCAAWSFPSMTLPISRQCLLATGRRPPFNTVAYYQFEFIILYTECVRRWEPAVLWIQDFWKWGPYV